MSWRQDCERVLTRVLREVSSIESPYPVLKPQIDLARADLSSEICIYAARKLNVTPDSLAHAVVEKSANQVIGSLEYERGFLNLRGPRNLGWLSQVEVPSSSDSIESSVVVVVRNSDLATARHLARAALQARLSSRPCKLFLLDATSISLLSSREGEKWYDTWWYATKTALQQSQLGTARTQIASEAFEKMISPNQIVTVWAEAGSTRHSHFKIFIENFRKKYKNFNLILSTNRWGSTPKCAIETLIGDSIDQFNLARVLYLAGNLLGEELDPNVPQLQERANILEVIKANSTRLSQIRSTFSGLYDERLVQGIAVNIFLRCRFLPLFVESAARQGEISEFLSALDDLCYLFQRFFNQPETRKRLQSDNDAELALLITGVQDALAYILTLLDEGAIELTV